jgi:hypothetical protein
MKKNEVEPGQRCRRGPLFESASYDWHEALVQLLDELNLVLTDPRVDGASAQREYDGVGLNDELLDPRPPLFPLLDVLAINGRLDPASP